jgi:hypothetical protein
MGAVSGGSAADGRPPRPFRPKTVVSVVAGTVAGIGTVRMVDAAVAL